MTKKIYVIYTGGTIGMKPTDSGYAPSGNMQALLDEKLPPHVRKGLPDFDLVEYDQLIDSSNIRPENWKQIATDIAEHYDDYDGFVVLHGTDTMAFSSSMMSFMLRNLNKPVVFTGSQIPLCEARSDGLENFVGALSIATDERINEVCLYFNGRLMRGNRARKQNAYLFDAFDSPNFPWLGRADINIELSDYLLLKPDSKPEFHLECAEDTQVGILQLFPGITADWIEAALNQPVQAFIIRTYGTGNAPDGDQALLDTLKKATDNGKIIVNLTQCHRGTVHQGSYAAGSALAEAGVIGGLDTTTEAMFCKLHHLLSKGHSSEEIKTLVGVDLAGELTE
ncbi:asparaginase [Endozoicomonas arenosclerae]|uniref:asparaginase n=1 Tax=Endozoicomonas arenosclerae TaxID=1633495 RepID=UPI0007851E72|nr:asparaginase [Endozoicomonas arenosclerae]